MKSSRIHVVGSVVMDIITRSKALPKPGETVLGSGSVSLRVGGKGLNQAILTAEALKFFRVEGNPEVSFEACIGKDILGAYARQKLLESGINVKLHEKKTVSTGTGSIFMDETGQNSIIVSLGANNELSVDPYETSLASNASIVLCQLEVPLRQSLLTFKHAPDDALKILNVAPARAHAPEDSFLVGELLKKSDIVIANEIEANDLNLVENAPSESDEKGMKITDKCPKAKAVIITRGRRGFRLVQRSALSKTDIPGSADLPVDAVGAGDCFVGYFAAAMLIPKTTILASAILANEAAGKYVAQKKPEIPFDDLFSKKTR